MPRHPHRSGSSSWRATASDRRSPRRRSPCCARPIASSGWPLVHAGHDRVCGVARARHHAAGGGGRRRQGRRRRDPRAGVAQRLSAGRARRPEPVGRAAQAPRPLRQYPAGEEPRRFSAALRVAGRPRHRAREHRRLLRRPQHGRRLRRVHADTRPCACRAQDHPRRLDPDRGGGLCARRCAAAGR